MANPLYYTRTEAGKWAVVDLTTHQVQLLDNLPFPMPEAPVPQEPPRRSNTPVAELFADLRKLDRLRALKGKITDEAYAHVMQLYAKGEI